MGGRLKPYPEYKDSGLPWLGFTPVHWEAKTIRAITKTKSEKNRPDLPLLSVYRDYGVISKDSRDDNYNRAGENLSAYKAVRPGDLVLNKMKTWQGSLGVSELEGIVSPAYITCILDQSLNRRFIHYLLRSHRYIYEYNRLSYGVRVDQWDMRYGDFKQIPLFIPSLSEQNDIVSYLDRKLAEIDRFIANKRKMIELLKEQKTAIINRAVTKGINPDVKPKPTGIEWLGEIPEHWEAVKIKHIAKINPSKSSSGYSKDSKELVTFLPMEKVSEEGEIDCSIKQPISELWGGFTFFKRGDVVIAKITPCFENGKGAYLNTLDTDIAFGTTEFIVLRPLFHIEGDFLYYLTRCAAFRTQGAEFMTGSAGQHRVPVDFVKNFEFGLPSIEEQRTIVEFIKMESSMIDNTISKANREIELIQEYRTSLISDVVTGKVDVREKA